MAATRIPAAGRWGGRRKIERVWEGEEEERMRKAQGAIC
jgi:hypothetical protein